MKRSEIRDEAERLVRDHGASARTAALEEILKAKRQKNVRLAMYRSRVAMHVAKRLEAPSEPIEEAS
jgi:hypothetical protein